MGANTKDGVHFIPSLSDYGIDPITGFMPSPPPLWRLSAYYDPWETIMDHLNPLILSGVLRKKVEKLPLLSIDSLVNKPEQRRAFIVLTFIAHSYMQGVPNADTVISILPKAIAVPWFELSLRLNINPVVSYSSTALWNWYLVDNEGPMDLRYFGSRLTFASNLASMHTFSGSYDEAWFYLVPLSIELAGAPAIVALLEAQKAVVANDALGVKRLLTIVADCTEQMSTLLKRMYEKCDPAVFWKRIRSYSGGSKNSEVFPNGVFYEGVTNVGSRL
ncbi:hypothetical protein HDU91_002103 [Kappamyces sp. JEL0680]|nr:hypothetical protein HDU91_002103 [Kappamyces sp. JEL0680]